MPALLPRLLWSYWHAGEPPPLVCHSRESWAAQAPDWEVRLLNRSSVAAWLLEGVDFPASLWSQKPEHQALTLSPHCLNLAPPVPLLYTASSPPLHHLYNTSSPPLHHLYTASTPPLHDHYTASTPPLHHLYTASSPPLHHLYTTSTPPLHRLYTTSTPPLHRLFTTSTPPLHHLYTTSTPPLHHLYTTSSPPLHHLYTTSTPPLHHLFTTSTPPLHHLFTTSTPPLHRLFTISTPPLHHLFTTSSPPLHHLYTTSTPPLHHLYTTSTPPLHGFYTASTPPLHHLYTTSTPPLHHLYTTSTPLLTSTYPVSPLHHFDPTSTLTSPSTTNLASAATTNPIRLSMGPHRKPELSPQSDMIGIALQRRYGGLWVDASVILTQPLDWLLNEMQSHGGLVDFVRRARGPARSGSNYMNDAGVPELFFFASLPNSKFVSLWHAELWQLWARCPKLDAPGCVDRYDALQMNAWTRAGTRWRWGERVHPELRVHLHPGSVAQWVLQHHAAARLAFAPLRSTSPLLLITSAHARIPIASKHDMLSTINRLRLPLPAAADVVTAAGSWWEEILRLSLRPPPPRRRCEVISLPLLGLGNRLRSLASAYLFAERYGCSFHMRWRVTYDMPHAWADLFATPFAPPPDGFDEAAVGPPRAHENHWIEAYDPYRASTTVFRGGHSFKLPSMPSALYLWRKHLFFSRLRPAAAVAPHLLDTSGFLCYAKVDDIDLGANFFSRHSPLEVFVARVQKLPAHRRVYVASTSHEAKLAIRRAHAAARVTWAGEAGANASARGDDALWHRRDFIVDWFALATCSSILGSYGSSFSDEAVHYRGITKECLTARAVRADDDGYHALHTVADGQRFVSGWSSALADIYAEDDQPEVMSKYLMRDPLKKLFDGRRRGTAP
ncbi:hypothetical protein AB1Y20_014362 [Prymnesium parvum]|uniref:Protein xylosyltransferase n=1 Tax=Prymnesium parvum TaxID=97485 RepID=A0AB34IHE4_PRYPA